MQSRYRKRSPRKLRFVFLDLFGPRRPRSDVVEHCSFLFIRVTESGVVSPALAGFLLDRTGDLTVAFIVTSTVMLAGGFVWVFGVGRLKPAVPLFAEAAADLA